MLGDPVEEVTFGGSMLVPGGVGREREKSGCYLVGGGGRVRGWQPNGGGWQRGGSPWTVT